MKKAFKLVLISFSVLLAYLLLWPVPIDPVSWQGPDAPEAKGMYAPNDLLAGFETIDIGGFNGPEAITESANGDIYATTHQGWIVRWVNGSNEMEKWVNVEGRPLGIAFDASDDLWVANAYIGLQKVTPAGEITVATTVADGIEIRYADDLVVTPNGKVYLSDASTKFPSNASTLNSSLLDLMEHGLHGRIIEFDPATKSSKVIMRDLSFANGVTSSQNGHFLMIAETGNYRIWKYWLEGAKAGQSEVITDNLPGFPDNIHRGLNGRYWLGLTSPRNIMDFLSDKPFLRKVVQRLPAFIRPNIVPFGHVIAIDENGEILRSLQDPKGAYPATTGAWETHKHLYVSSLTAPIMARYKKENLGLK